MENIQKKTGKTTETKTIRMPKELVERIEQDAYKQNRDFTKQVLFIIKKYYEIITMN